jgi:uncharacterized protein (TIRG00374 family)
MSVRGWISLATVGLVGLIVFLARDELQQAWEALGRVNLWILALLIPAQIISYYAAGEMIFSYLWAKSSTANVSKRDQVRMALELNFVNHIVPSGGLSGVSYLSWRLSKYGISPGRATMAQVVRYAMGFGAYAVLLVIAVLLVTVDGNINRWIILISSGLVTLFLIVGIGGAFMLSSIKRLQKFSIWLTPAVNKLVRKLTFNKVKRILNLDEVTKFFSELHYDYKGLMRDRKVLKKPFIWGIIFTIFDAGLFLITFWALGHPVNPAPVFIAYGVATLAGIVAITPGGTGVYEAVMVAFLAMAGLGSGVALVGILLTRAIMLGGTILFGYIFYQKAILKYGKA